MIAPPFLKLDGSYHCSSRIQTKHFYFLSLNDNSLLSFIVVVVLLLLKEGSMKPYIDLYMCNLVVHLKEYLQPSMRSSKY